jgi:YidC/Oxa1 family membrane protein insertase
MEKRIVLAFVLSFAVLYGYSRLFPPQSTVPPPGPAEQAVPSESVPQTTPSAPPIASTSTPSAQAVESDSAQIEGKGVEELSLDTALYTASFSNQGAALKSFKLKEYADEKGAPIELINSVAGQKLGSPLALLTGDLKTDQALAAALFVVSRIEDGVVFEYAAGGLQAKKSIRLIPDSYELAVESVVSRDGKKLPHWVVWQGGFGDQSVPADPSKDSVVYQSDAKFKRLNVGSIKEPQEMTISRVGIEDRYFLAMFVLPESGAPVKINKQEYAAPDGKAIPTTSVAAPMPQTGPIKLYVGPKMESTLRKADPQLSAVIDYGFFEVITRPLMLALLWIHSYIGNFGWSIILLTVLINLVLFPLKLKQQVSMQKMQKIQPQMRTLQDKYKKLKPNDPRKAQAQAEMMDLYKQHGVNPLGGCLPLLLQMPFLYAVWNMLSVSIELRQAPWILWVRDLSQHDPTYVMPILFGVSMLVMQKMTPVAGDPMQAKMMMIMPILFTFMFRTSQSGLMLYWLTSNLAGIGQQVFITKYWTPRTDERIQPRSAKKGPPPSLSE